MDYTVLCDAITNLREGRVDPLSFLDDDDEPLMPVSRCGGQGATSLSTPGIVLAAFDVVPRPLPLPAVAAVP